MPDEPTGVQTEVLANAGDSGSPATIRCDSDSRMSGPKGLFRLSIRRPSLARSAGWEAASDSRCREISMLSVTRFKGFVAAPQAARYESTIDE
jgi:hypothetical protein